MHSRIILATDRGQLLLPWRAQQPIPLRHFTPNVELPGILSLSTQRSIKPDNLSNTREKDICDCSPMLFDIPRQITQHICHSTSKLYLILERQPDHISDRRWTWRIETLLTWQLTKRWKLQKIHKLFAIIRTVAKIVLPHSMPQQGFITAHFTSQITHHDQNVIVRKTLLVFAG